MPIFRKRFGWFIKKRLVGQSNTLLNKPKEKLNKYSHSFFLRLSNPCLFQNSNGQRSASLFDLKFILPILYTIILKFFHSLCPLCFLCFRLRIPCFCLLMIFCLPSSLTVSVFVCLTYYKILFALKLVVIEWKFISLNWNINSHHVRSKR